MFDIIECEQAVNCKNSPTISGEFKMKCHICRFSPDNDNKGQVYWKPVDGKAKHPTLVKEHNNKQFAKRTEAIAKRQNRNKARMVISRKAIASENNLESAVIKATKNSGRSNRDGDFTAGGFIGLDNKLQTTNVEPIVRLAELDKAIADAKRGGMLIGGLVIETKHGVSVTVFKTDDFAREILSRLI